MNIACENSLFTSLCEQVKENSHIPAERYANHDIKRGLRNADGSGVVAGVTRVCNVHGYVLSEGEKIPAVGELTYRGYAIEDLVAGSHGKGRFGFEEVVFLLLFGCLPTEEQLAQFCQLLSDNRELPEYFAEDMILNLRISQVQYQLGIAAAECQIPSRSVDDPFGMFLVHLTFDIYHFRFNPYTETDALLMCLCDKIFNTSREFPGVHQPISKS